MRANPSEEETITGPGPEEEMRPGDEAPPDEGSTAENACPVCGGEGTVDGEPCGNCNGTGRVTEAIGGG